MIAPRRCPLCFVLLASGCTPGAMAPTTAATDSATDSATSSSETSTSGSGETTGPPALPCSCDVPVIHEGSLDLEGLAAYEGQCLVEVTGGLSLNGVVDPALLGPLAHVQRVDWLTVSDSPGIVDLAPLACLREAQGGISLRDNSALVDISALARIERAESLQVEGTPIASLSSFAPGYQGLRDLILRDLPELTDLDAIAGWPGLHEPKGYFKSMDIVISKAPKLTSIAGLASPLADAVAKSDHALDDTSLSVTLADLPALASLVGLEPFNLGGLVLRRLPMVQDLGPLTGLMEATDVVVAGLDSLLTLEGLGALQTAGSLTLGGCDDGEALLLADLTGLDSLLTLEHRLAIIDAPAMTDLTGAPLLESASQLDVIDAPFLSDEAIATLAAQVGVSGLDLCAGDVVACGCLGKVPEALQSGCPAIWSGDSAVAGDGEGGPFNGVTAFLGLWGGASIHAELVLVLLGPSSDVAEAKEGGLYFPSVGAPVVILHTGRNYKERFGTSPASATFHLSGVVSVEGTPTLEISAAAGTWATLDPDDPPRLLGQLTTEDANAPLVLNGPFDAAFCDAFVYTNSD